MKKITKAFLVATLALTATVGTGCSQSSQTSSGQTVDEQTQRSVYSAALLAEDRLAALFEAKTGLEGEKEVTYYVSKKSPEEAVKFLSSITWNEATAKKEFEAVLGDKALVEKANKALEAKAKADKKEFKPVVAVTTKDKIGANAITGAKFEDVKISSKDGKYTVEYKGLKYTLEKNDASFRVVGKEGTLQK